MRSAHRSALLQGETAVPAAPAAVIRAPGSIRRAAIAICFSSHPPCRWACRERGRASTRSSGSRTSCGRRRACHGLRPSWRWRTGMARMSSSSGAHWCPDACRMACLGGSGAPGVGTAAMGGEGRTWQTDLQAAAPRHPPGEKTLRGTCGHTRRRWSPSLGPVGAATPGPGQPFFLFILVDVHPAPSSPVQPRPAEGRPGEEMDGAGREGERERGKGKGKEPFRYRCEPAADGCRAGMPQARHEPSCPHAPPAATPQAARLRSRCATRRCR
jgi:hypothetical protein